MQLPQGSRRRCASVLIVEQKTTERDCPQTNNITSLGLRHVKDQQQQIFPRTPDKVPDNSGTAKVGYFVQVCLHLYVCNLLNILNCAN